VINGDTALSFVFPSSTDELRGTLTDALKIPIQAVAVKVLDMDTDRVLSTTSVSQADGSFRVLLSPVTLPKQAHLLLSPTDQSRAGLPTVKAVIDLGPNPAMVSIGYPALPPPVNIKTHIEGQSSSGTQVPIVGAHCTFTSPLNDLKLSSGQAVSEITYVAEGDSDAQGQVAVDLLPGDNTIRHYDVRVAPAADSEFQTSTHTQAIDVSAVQGVTISLVQELRDEITGRVSGPQGPASNVSVVPSPALLDTTGDTSQVDTTQTGVDGSFSVHLDSGSYDIGFQPAAQSGLPRWWVERAHITADTDLGVVQIPMGVMVTGHVTSADGTAVANASLRLYSVPPPNLALCNALAATCVRQAHLRAAATSKSGGTVLLVLPAQTN
jgi:hypothetical protein